MRSAILFLAVAAYLASLSFSAPAKEIPPPGSAPKPFKLAATDDFTLPNGMQVTLVPYGVIPKVAVRAYVDAGAVREPSDKVWLSRLTSLLLKEGTAARSSEQIAREAADMGGQLDIHATGDSFAAGGIVLSDHGPQFVRLLADVLIHASLPASDLDRLKTDLARELSVDKSQPNPLAREKFLQTLFPNQPYGRIFPSAEALNGYSLADVQTFFDQNFAASRTHLYVAGKFEAAIKDAIKEAFGDWKRGQPTALPAAEPVSQYSLQQVDRPGAAQSTVYVGLPMPAPKSPDFLTLDVMDSLLGGSFASRITSNIREQKGYTYSPGSVFAQVGSESYWVETADVTTAVTGPSLHEIFSEVNRLRKDPPSAEELKSIQSYMAGLFVLQNTSSANAVIAQLHFVDSQELSRSFLVTYTQKINAVSPGDVQRVAETYLSPSKMTVVVVGDKSKVAEQLKTFEAEPR